MELIREKPLSKITVSEICQKAEINRGTFYRYYLDVYDLAEQQEKNGLEQVDQMIRGISSGDFVSVFSEVLRFFAKDPSFFFMVASGAFSSTEENSFFQKVFVRCYQVLYEDHPQDTDRHDTRFLSFMTGGSGALVAYWLKSGMKEPPEEIAEIISGYAELIIRDGDRTTGS